MGFTDFIGGMVGSGVGKAIGEAATPFTNALVAIKKGQSDVNIIDKQTNRDMVLGAFQADTQLGLVQRLLAEGDRSHWSTRWIRPSFCALAWVWMAGELYFWFKQTAPALQLDIVVKGLFVSIVGAVFVFRPTEKHTRMDTVNSVIENQTKPTLLQKIRGK